MPTRASRRAVVLIDYDNARPNPAVAERNSADLQAGLLSVFATITAALSSSPVQYGELRLRFYGGWVHEDGRWADRADWMRAEMRSLKGLHNGIRIIPDLAVALMALPNRPLRGTVRVRKNRSGYSLQQKMVDTMLATDLVLLQLDPEQDVIVISDDDDMVPALMSAQSRHGRLRVLRRRALGLSCNDTHLTGLGAQVDPF